MSESFSTRTRKYRSILKLEFLIDEDPWGKKWGFHDHFLINERQARAILAAVPDVWCFVRTHGAEPDQEIERESQSDAFAESLRRPTSTPLGTR